MGHCPGCGAGTRSPGGTYGHILGCGINYPEDEMEDRRVPWNIDDQRAVLQDALAEAKVEVDVNVLARALKKALDRYHARGR